MTTNWNKARASRDEAANIAEMIVQGLEITKPPVSPFDVIRSERRRLVAFGDDFGDAFDGRLEYQKPKFIIFYNTKYDAWPHKGKHHPKVTFTIAHEVGHFCLARHRNYLKKGGSPHGSQTEFVSDNLSEREADAFAAGLLMPKFLADDVVNAGPPEFKDVQEAKDLFEVSLTSMMLRWVQLSNFPCAMCSVRDGSIEWGLTSDAFKKAGAYKVNRGKRVTSRAATKFISVDPSISRYRDEERWGSAEHWLDFERTDLGVVEHFVAIPSTKQVLVFITADEEDTFKCLDDDDRLENSDE